MHFNAHAHIAQGHAYHDDNNNHARNNLKLRTDAMSRQGNQ